MSSPPKKRTRKHTLKDGKKHRRRVLRSPCNRPPETVTGLVGEFDLGHRRRHARLRGRFRWDEVSKDTSGFTVRLHHYDVEIQHTGIQEKQEVILTGFSSAGSDKFKFKLANGNKSGFIGGAGSGAPYPYTKAGIRDAIQAIRGLRGGVNITALDDSGFFVEFTLERPQGASDITDEVGCTGVVTTITDGKLPSNDNQWNPHPRRFKVPAKDDLDANDKAHLIVPGGFRKKHQYRFRVRAVVPGGCKGAWSPYEDLGRPHSDRPPDVQNVKIFPVSSSHVRLEWDAPDDEDNANISSEDIAFYQVGLRKDTSARPDTFADFAKKDKDHKGQRISFRINPASSGTFYGWVRSVSDEGEFGEWIPATTAGNSNPDATPDGETASGDTGDAEPFVGARMSRANSQTFTTGVAALVDFDVNEFDTDGFVNLSTNRLTIPTGLGGKYEFFGNIRWGFATAGSQYIALKLTGAYLSIIEGKPNATSARQGLFVGSGPIDVVAGDYMELEGFQSSGGDLAINDNNASDPWLSCRRIGD